MARRDVARLVADRLPRALYRLGRSPGRQAAAGVCMMGRQHYSHGIWLVDFEFHPERGREGNPPDPVCMVARDFVTGRTLRLWREQLQQLTAAPFPTDDSALLVAYYASAEIGCFLALG